MRRCPDCREQVPTHETRCPFCDASLVRRKAAPGSQRSDGAKSNRTWVIVLVAALGGGVLACGGCCGGLFWLGRSEIEKEIRAALEHDPVVEEHVGTITVLRWELLKSAAAEGEDVQVYRIEGTKGKGYARVESVTNFVGAEEILSGTLELDDGRTFELSP